MSLAIAPLLTCSTAVVLPTLENVIKTVPASFQI